MVSGGPSNEGAASILRAVGSLLVALSGGQAAQVGQTLSELQTAQTAAAAQADPPPVASPPLTGYPRPQRAPTPASRPGETPRATASTDLLDDVELVLTDARERAQAIIDESTERARELIRQERAAIGAPAIDPRAFDDLRSGLRNLMTEVRDIQQRLARIEHLIRDQNERAAHGAPSGTPVFAPPSVSHRRAEPEYTEPRVAEPQAAEPQAAEPQIAEPQVAEPQVAEPQYAEPHNAEPQYAEPQYAEPQYAEPQYAEPQYAEPQYAEPEEDAENAESNRTEEAPPAPAPSPPRSPFSVVPPQRREWTAPDASEAAPPGHAEVPPAVGEPVYEPPMSPPRTAAASVAAERIPVADAWDAAETGRYDAPTEDAASPLVTFMPSDGAITLRVAPVAGFQGLMRVQDALTHLRAVRAASVDAYSQGEARLRIELSEASDSDEIAEGLTRALGGTARVEEASEVHRELFITLR